MSESTNSGMRAEAPGGIHLEWQRNRDGKVVE
jgi:hypothetical protein